MSIHSGSYTIGAGGDYENLTAFYYDIGSMDGDLTGVVLNDLNLDDFEPFISFNGYTFKLTSNTYHDGYVKSPIISNTMIYPYFLGTGNFVLENLVFNNCNIMLENNDSTDFDVNFCIFENVSGSASFYFTSASTHKAVVNICRCIFTNISNTYGILFSDCVLNIENNTFHNILSFLDMGSSGSAPSGTLTNNMFDFTGTYFIKNIGVVSGYNNSSNNTAVSNANWLSGSNNVINVSNAIEWVSVVATDTTFLKLANASTIKDSGITPSLASNTQGIRHNSIPHDGDYSIGADDFTSNIPALDPEKIRFSYNSEIVDARLPLYPYTSIIDMSFDKIDCTDETILYLDYGSDYDKRTCQCKLLLTLSEVDELNDIINDYSTNTVDSLTIEMGTNSSFFPFGHDIGNMGPFTIKIDVITAPKLSSEYKDMFEVELKLYLCDTPPSYTFITEQTQGLFSIGTVTGLRFPPNYFQPGRKQEWVNTQLEWKYSTNRLIKSIGYVTTNFNLQCNISKAQRLLYYITSTNRTNTYDISNDSGGYIMGYDNGTGTKTINARLLNNSIVVTTKNYNDINMDLSFGIKKADII